MSSTTNVHTYLLHLRNKSEILETGIMLSSVLQHMARYFEMLTPFLSCQLEGSAETGIIEFCYL